MSWNRTLILELDNCAFASLQRAVRNNVELVVIRLTCNSVFLQAMNDDLCRIGNLFQRLLDFIVPDVVHILYNGRIVKTAGKELALELEEKGYGWIKQQLGE